MLQMKTKIGRAARFWHTAVHNGPSHALLFSSKSAMEASMTLNASCNFLFLSKKSGPAIAVLPMWTFLEPTSHQCERLIVGGGSMQIYENPLQN